MSNSTKHIEIGELVEPTPESGFILRSGCGYYLDAVCVSLSPLVLVSWDAHMLWSATIKTEYFRSKGRVAASVMRRCKKRLSTNTAVSEPGPVPSTSPSLPITQEPRPGSL
jgi:hypothetical protein